MAPTSHTFTISGCPLRWHAWCVCIVSHALYVSRVTMSCILSIANQEEAARTAPQEPFAKARCPSEERIRDWERLVEYHDSRICVGVVCALVHGLLLCKTDFQRSLKCNHTDDAGQTQHHFKSWAASRRGVLDTEWRASWLSSLDDVGIVVKDCVLHGKAEK